MTLTDEEARKIESECRAFGWKMQAKAEQEAREKQQEPFIRIAAALEKIEQHLSMIGAALK